MVACFQMEISDEFHSVILKASLIEIYLGIKQHLAGRSLECNAILQSIVDLLLRGIGSFIGLKWAKYERKRAFQEHLFKVRCIVKF